MKKTLLNHSQSLFVKFLVSYLVILIIPLTIGIVSYTKSTQVVKQEMEDYNVAILQQAQKVLDERLKSIDQLALDISLNTKIQSLLLTGSTADPEAMVNTYRSIIDLPKYSKVNDFIVDFFIYFKNGEFILTDKGKYSSSNFFSSELVSSEPDYDWNKLMEERYVKQLFPAQKVTYRNSNRDVIKYITSLPMGSGKSSLGNFTALIDVGEIEDTLWKKDVLKNGVSYIVNKEGKVIMSKGDESLIGQSNIPEDKTGFFYSRQGNEELIFAYAKSEVSDWTYITAVPTRDYMDDLRIVKNMIILITLFGILLGIVISVLLARRNFNPIKKVLTTLTDSLNSHLDSGIGVHKSRNELDVISNVVVNTLKEYKNIKNTLNVQMPVLRGNLLLQIMKGNLPEQSEIYSLMDKVGISFDFEDFCVLIINIVNCTNQDLENEWVLIKVIISNVFEELGNNRGKAYVVDAEWNQMTLMVNIDPAYSDKTSVMKELAIQGENFIADNFSILLNIGIGRDYKGMEGIGKSYSEALKALQYGTLNASGSLTLFSDMPDINQSYAYSFDISEKLTNLVKAGDLNKVKVLLQQFIKENFRNQKQSLEMSRCIFFDIMSTAINVLHSIEVNYSEVFGDAYDPYQQLTACRNINEMEETLDYIFDMICRYINEKQRSHNETLKDDIMRYLDEHFTEQDLSLIKVATYFNLNHTYLSFFFKEQTGENFSEYIRGLKIDRAVQLLKETDISVEEISNILGYTNCGVLIRNFKKVKGITPGQFRNNLT